MFSFLPSFRFVDNNLETKEYFIGFKETTEATGEALAELLLAELRSVNLELSKLRAQAYDGGSNMKGGNQGVQARIRAIEARAIYIHCLAHSLNLALQDAVKEIPAVRNALGFCHELVEFVRASPKRTTAFEDIVRTDEEEKHNLKPMCPTRWTVRHTSVHSVLSQLEAVQEFLQNVVDEENNAHANGLLYQMRSSTTIAVLLSCERIFELTERLSKRLQARTMTFTGMQEALNFTVAALKDIKYAEIQARLKKFEDRGLVEHRATKNPVDPEQVHARLIQVVTEEMQSRFEQDQMRPLRAIESVVMSSLAEEMDESAFTVVTDFYGSDLKPVPLCNQLGTLKNAFNGQKTPADFAGFLEAFKKLHIDVRGMLPEVVTLLQLLLVVPVTSSEAERTFSTLRRAKTWLRSAMCPRRLTALALMNHHRDRLDLYSDAEIAEEFAKRRPTRRKTFGSFLEKGDLV